MPAFDEGEERHDRVARPWVQAVLQALVGRDGRGQRQLSAARELGRWLLAEGPEALAGVLQVAARRRVGARDQTDGEPRDRRMDARLEQGDPERDADHRRRGGAPDRREAQADEHAEEPNRDGQRRERDVGAVDGGDDEQRAQVVDHGQGEQEDPQARGAAGRRQRQQAERERRVGRHRGAPAVRAPAAGVEGQVDGDGDEHAPEPGHDGQRQARAIAQLAEIELALGLQADDQEEERHEAVVDPLAQVGRERPVPEPDRELGRPHRLVGIRPRRVGPQQRGHGRDQQDDRAARLGAEEVANRRGEVACPRRAARPHRGLRGRHRRTD